MSALLEASSRDKKQAHSDRLRVAQQRVDYVVCDSHCDVVAIVELDDKTYSNTKDPVRDGRLDQAGIRTVRFRSRNKPTPEAIRTSVLPISAIAPIITANCHLSKPANNAAGRRRD
jgi:very-short-patch-repair endonuclease